MTCAEPTAKSPSTTLLALLRLSKSPTAGEVEWRALAIELGKIYYPQMSLVDVMHILIRAYEEALSDPRFELNVTRGTAQAFALAPVQGIFAAPGVTNVTEMLSVETFYNCMIGHVMGQLRRTRVDWCVGLLREDEAAA